MDLVNSEHRGPEVEGPPCLHLILADVLEFRAGERLQQLVQANDESLRDF